MAKQSNSWSFLSKLPLETEPSLDEAIDTYIAQASWESAEIKKNLKTHGHHILHTFFPLRALVLQTYLQQYAEQEHIFQNHGKVYGLNIDHEKDIPQFLIDTFCIIPQYREADKLRWSIDQLNESITHLRKYVNEHYENIGFFGFTSQYTTNAAFLQEATSYLLSPKKNGREKFGTGEQLYQGKQRVMESLQDVHKHIRAVRQTLNTDIMVHDP